jgi:hypothetical protein
MEVVAFLMGFVFFTICIIYVILKNKKNKDDIYQTEHTIICPHCNNSVIIANEGSWICPICKGSFVYKQNDNIQPRNSNSDYINDNDTMWEIYKECIIVVTKIAIADESNISQEKMDFIELYFKNGWGFNDEKIQKAKKLITLHKSRNSDYLSSLNNIYNNCTKVSSSFQNAKVSYDFFYSLLTFFCLVALQGKKEILFTEKEKEIIRNAQLEFNLSDNDQKKIFIDIEEMIKEISGFK